MGAPQQKSTTDRLLRRMDAACRFGGDERLKVDLIDDKLSTIWASTIGAVTSITGSSLKNKRPSGIAPDFTRKFQPLKKIKKIVSKHMPRAKVVDAGRVDLELLKELQDILQARGNEIAAIGRIGPDKKTKSRRRQPLALEITLRHCQLVEVRQQRQVVCRRHKTPSLINERSLVYNCPK